MKLTHYAKLGLAALSLGLTSAQSFSQGFSPTEYKKALWMTARAYGGQRSGTNNWLLYNHLPSGVDAKYKGTAFIEDQDTDGYDLSGGWHDCGDHVKFGHTEFYSAYVLLKGYAEFPRGYDDYYSYDYKGYGTSGDWSWEGGKHDPNGIPDILDEVKHATDFFIKCARNSTTFYYQVGAGEPDHKQWVTAVKMQTLTKSDGGQTRTVYKNPADASMASFCGATLALMSRVYRKFDPVYADKCLIAAKYAYDYAKANPGTAGPGDGSTFYQADKNWKDDYTNLCSELFWATGTVAYKDEVLKYTIGVDNGQNPDVFGNNYGFDYQNNGDIAIYNLALLGKTNAASTFNTIVTKHYLGNIQADGQFAGGNISWGPLRYNGNTALMVALWQKLNGTTSTVNKYIYDNIDYILGKNSANLSFVVGFGAKSPKFPHHRNVYLRDDNPTDAIKRQMPIPTKNQQFGLLVGGTRTPSTFIDDVVTYTHTEGGIDYNAGLVGALAFINSVLSPVDTTKFGNPTPDLGNARSICGASSLELDSKITTDGKKTFEWIKDGVQLYAPSTTRNKITITQSGKYTCKLDSAGKWSTQASVDILGVLPDPTLAATGELCSPAILALNSGVSGTGFTYAWTKDGKGIAGANAQTYTAYYAGTYKVTVSASGCPSKSASMVVTSKLPTVINDTICQPGTAYLFVSGNGSPYEWYDVALNGTALATGTSYQPTISANKTFYVKDASSIAATAGPSASSHTLASATNGGNIGIRFTAAKAFTITQMTVLPFVYSCNGTSDNIKLTVVLKQGGTTVGTYVATEATCKGAQSTAPFTSYYIMTFSTPISIPAAGTYELTPSAGNQVVWFEGGANFTTMDATGVMDVTDDTRDDKNASFPGIFDIKIQAGSTCDRAPVFAVLDSSPNCIDRIPNGLEEEMIASTLKVFPNPSSGSFQLQASTTVELRLIDDLGREVAQYAPLNNGQFGENLSPGLYHLIVTKNGQLVKTVNLIKK